MPLLSYAFQARRVALEAFQASLATEVEATGRRGQLKGTFCCIEMVGLYWARPGCSLVCPGCSPMYPGCSLACPGCSHLRGMACSHL